MAAFKNPLTYTFGLILKRFRGLLSLSNADDYAEILRLKPTYYRTLEAGINNLSPLQGIKIIDSINEGVVNPPEVSYEGLTIYLNIVSYIESLSKIEVTNSVDEMSRNDRFVHHLDKIVDVSSDKVRKLLEVFKLAFRELNDENLDYLIKKYHLEETLWRYLVQYDLFDKDELEIQENTKNTFLSDVPSIYLNLLHDTKENLMRLPVKIGFSGLWQWEDHNKGRFTETICIINDPQLITNFDNLSKYKYRHLWENQFTSVKIICRPSKKHLTKQYLTEEFHKNLRKSLLASEEDSLLHSFEEKVKKVIFKVIEPSHELYNSKEINDLLSGKVDHELNEKQYDSTWIFTLKTKTEGNVESSKMLVGFMAKINQESKRMEEGITLTYGDAINRLKKLNQLWSTLIEPNTN